jgi:hypothetical protein
MCLSKSFIASHAPDAHVAEKTRILLRLAAVVVTFGSVRRRS